MVQIMPQISRALAGWRADEKTKRRRKQM